MELEYQTLLVHTVLSWQTDSTEYVYTVTIYPGVSQGCVLSVVLFLYCFCFFSLFVIFVGHVCTGLDRKQHINIIKRAKLQLT